VSEIDSGYPDGFFERGDPASDAIFYRPPRLVTHIDDAAIVAVSELYAELGIDGSSREHRRVLDLMSSWVSHLRVAPDELVVLGMNASELDANSMATERIVQDLNADPVLPFGYESRSTISCAPSRCSERPLESCGRGARLSSLFRIDASRPKRSADGSRRMTKVVAPLCSIIFVELEHSMKRT